MTLSDLERRGVSGQNFLADLHNYARMVLPRMTEFGKITQVGRSIFLGVSPYTKKAGPWLPPSPNILGPCYVRANGLTYGDNNDEIWCGNSWGRSVFLGVSHDPVPTGGAQRPPNFWDLLTRAHSTRDNNRA